MGKSQAELPIFLLVGPTLKRLNIHYLPLQKHIHQSDETLLVFPLEVSSDVSTKTTLSLLVNPSNTIQWQLINTLSRTSYIEIWECDHKTFEVKAQQLIKWPEMYRSELREILKLPKPATQWPAMQKKWIDVSSYSTNESLPQEKKVTTPITWATTSSHPASVITEKLQPTIPAAQQKPSPFSYPYWRAGTNGVPECLVRIPQNMFVNKFSVSVAAPSLKTFSEGYIVVFPFTLSSSKRPSITGTSIFNPDSSTDRTLLTQLTQTKQINMLCFQEGDTSANPQSKQVSLSKNVRNAIVQILARKLSKTTQWEKVKERWFQQQKHEKKQLQEQKLRNFDQRVLKAYPLPTNWNLLFSQQVMIMSLEVRSRRLCILLETSLGNKIKSAKVEFQVPDVSQSQQAKPRVHVHVIFRNASDSNITEKTYSCEIHNSISLTSLMEASTVPILLVSDTEEKHFLQTKITAWPQQEITKYYHNMPTAFYTESSNSNISELSFLSLSGHCQLKENCRDYRREKW
jgi:hypothetical protein